VEFLWDVDWREMRNIYKLILLILIIYFRLENISTFASRADIFPNASFLLPENYEKTT